MSMARGQAAVAKCFWNLDLSSSPPCTESKRVSRSKFNGKCGSKRAMRGKIDLIKIPFEISCSLLSSTAERFSFRNFFTRKPKMKKAMNGSDWEAAKIMVIDEDFIWQELPLLLVSPPFSCLSWTTAAAFPADSPQWCLKRGPANETR